MPVKSIAYTNLSEHRGARRLWLEGRKLSRAGIEPGRRFDVVWNRDTRTVHLDFTVEDGERTVSRRSRNGRELPVIDVPSGAFEEALGEGLERAKVSITADRITLEVHPDDLAAQDRIGKLVEKLQRGEPIATGSLAHGGGILDHALHTGLKDAGVEARLAFAVEINPQALDAAATNNPIWDEDTLAIEGGMQEAQMADLPQVDILVAGLPCTGASKAGKAKNHNELTEDHPLAGALFVSFLKVVEKTNPVAVILENVTDYGHSAGASVIRAVLTGWGYALHETILEGNQFGALEDRRRMCLIAIHPDIDLRLDELVPTRNKEATLGEVLEDIDPDSELWKEYAYLIDKAERDIQKGNGFKMNFVDAKSEKVGTIGAHYYKVRSTEPKIRHPFDPKKMRQLTPTEHAAVKAIPPELVANLGLTLSHLIMGNSVIWSAFHAVGHHLGNAMQRDAGPEMLEYLEIDAAALPEVVEEIEYHFDENRPGQLTMF